MSKVIDYRVIDGYDIKAFRAEVLEFLSEGYVPAGGVAVNRGIGETHYFQAVILESE